MRKLKSDDLKWFKIKEAFFIETFLCFSYFRVRKHFFSRNEIDKVQSRL